MSSWSIAFDTAALQRDRHRRGEILGALARGVSSVMPEVAVRDVVRVGEGALTVSDHAYRLAGYRRIVILALGKAALGMASSVTELLAECSVPIVGVVVVPEGADRSTLPPTIDVVAGGHPLPSAESIRAGRRLLAAADEADRHDLVIALVSGGGSAMAEAPRSGVSLDDLIAVNRLLLGSGLPITEINAVRAQLSEVKGGGLGARCRPAELVTIVLSDVPGNDPSVVGGGPTIASTREPALPVLHRHSLMAEIPTSVRAALAGRPSSPGAALRHQVVVAADGRTAAVAVAAELRSYGHRVSISADLHGEARRVGERLGTVTEGGVTVYHGETTVTLDGLGVGGRNQELALAAALAIEGQGEVVVATLGTDGVDGPTDAAGAIVDGETVSVGIDLGLSAADHLARHDSHPYLDATGDLLRCGPTGTNVADLVVVYRDSS